MRLSPDMFNLARQVRAVTDHAANAAGRLADKEILKFANDETTIVQLKERISKTIDYLKATSKATSTAPKARRSASPSQAARHASSPVRVYCWATACQISTSTRRKLTTSFATAGWRSESAISWARRHREQPTLASGRAMPAFGSKRTWRLHSAMSSFG